MIAMGTAGLVLSVKVLVAGRRGWQAGWLDPASLTITTESQPAETVRPAQVVRICSWPRQREEEVALVPRATLPPPDPGNPGYVALLGALIGFDRGVIERETWPAWKSRSEWNSRNGMLRAAATPSEVPALAAATASNGRW